MIPQSRYLLFKGVYYYPSGGANDLHSDFYSRSDAEAVAVAESLIGDLGTEGWAHLIELEVHGIREVKDWPEL